MAKEHRYRLLWTMEPANMAVEEVEAQNKGACDAMLIVSIVYREDGTPSIQMHPLDGRTDSPLCKEDVFRVWVELAHRLLHTPGLPAYERGLAEFILLQTQHQQIQSNAPEGATSAVESPKKKPRVRKGKVH